MSLLNFKKKKVDKLLQQASELSENGQKDDAISVYKKAIELDPQDPVIHYNLGLIYKYENLWQDSFACNQKSYELNPDDQATRWNLAISATALRDWQTARTMWSDEGLDFEINDLPIESDFGRNPVRLNPDGNAEVVWGKRIDPVRLQIENVPLPESGYCAGDIVLHDGAPVGYRTIDDREYPVFNVLELFEPSPLSTYSLNIRITSQDDIDALAKIVFERDLYFEDWTTDYRLLCKACSEGVPHEHHDDELKKEWTSEHHIAIAAESEDEIQAIIDEWKTGDTRVVDSLECVLSRR